MKMKLLSAIVLAVQLSLIGICVWQITKGEYVALNLILVAVNVSFGLMMVKIIMS